MIKLYYSKGSPALAAHILLQDTGAFYAAQEVSIPKGQHKMPEFLALNPKGRLPVLETPDGMISENPAILEFIAATNPQAGLLPQGHFIQAQARALCAYLCATVHVAFAHKHRGSRWADNVDAIHHLQAKVSQNLRHCAAYVEGAFGHGPWAMGANYSYCDPYLFLLGRWMAANDLDLGEFPKLAAHHAAMRARPATQIVLARHEID